MEMGARDFISASTAQQSKSSVAQVTKTYFAPPFSFHRISHEAYDTVEAQRHFSLAYTKLISNQPPQRNREEEEKKIGEMPSRVLYIRF